MQPPKTAFIAIVGKANVGKSSILNRLLGSKIAIVSSKPQTTRTRIMGVRTTEDNVQLVFTDTPGFHRPRTKLGEKMVQAVSDSIAGVDACLFVAEALDKECNEAELELLEKIKKAKIPTLLAVNKIDTVKDKTDLMARIAYLSGLIDFEAVIPVSPAVATGLVFLLADVKNQAFQAKTF